MTTAELTPAERAQIETADAWFEYSETTHGQPEQRYREIEPWAWARLQQRLRAIRARLSASSSATAAR